MVHNPVKGRAITDAYLNEPIRWGGVVVPRGVAVQIAHRIYRDPKQRLHVSNHLYAAEVVDAPLWSVSGVVIGRDEAIRLLTQEENPFSIASLADKLYRDGHLDGTSSGGSAKRSDFEKHYNFYTMFDRPQKSALVEQEMWKRYVAGFDAARATLAGMRNPSDSEYGTEYPANESFDERSHADATARELKRLKYKGVRVEVVKHPREYYMGGMRGSAHPHTYIVWISGRETPTGYESSYDIQAASVKVGATPSHLKSWPLEQYLAEPKFAEAWERMYGASRNPSAVIVEVWLRPSKGPDYYWQTIRPGDVEQLYADFKDAGTPVIETRMIRNAAGEFVRKWVVRETPAMHNPSGIISNPAKSMKPGDYVLVRFIDGFFPGTVMQVLRDKVQVNVKGHVNSSGPQLLDRSQVFTTDEYLALKQGKARNSSGIAYAAGRAVGASSGILELPGRLQSSLAEHFIPGGAKKVRAAFRRGSESGRRAVSVNPVDHYLKGYKLGQEYAAKPKYRLFSVEGVMYEVRPKLDRYERDWQDREGYDAGHEYYHGFENGFIGGDDKVFFATPWRGDNRYSKSEAISPLFDSETKARRWLNNAAPAEKKSEYVVRFDYK